MLENLNENTIRKLKQLKITLKEEIKIIKNLNNDIVEVTEDEDDLMSEIQKSGLSRRKVFQTLFDIEEKTNSEQKGSSEIP